MYNEDILKFETVLDKCIDDIISCRYSVKECLEAYPEFAVDLEPLLETACTSFEAAAVEPRPEFRARARYEFYAAVDEMAARKISPWFSFTARWAQAAVGLAAGLMITGTGVVAAASGSLPGQALYSVKTFSEQVQAGLTFTDSGRTQMYAAMADKRVSEIVTLVDTGRAELVSEATDRLDANLSAMSGSAGDYKGLEIPPSLVEEFPGITPYPSDDTIKAENLEIFVILPQDSNLVQSLKTRSITGYITLVEKLNQAPEESRPILEQALAVYVRGYHTAIHIAR